MRLRSLARVQSLVISARVLRCRRVIGLIVASESVYKREREEVQLPGRRLQRYICIVTFFFFIVKSKAKRRGRGVEKGHNEWREEVFYIHTRARGILKILRISFVNARRGSSGYKVCVYAEGLKCSSGDHVENTNTFISPPRYT